MGKAPALQDGGYRDTQRVTEGERLDGEGGPQGCLLHSPNPCGSPTHALVSGGVGTLSVHIPAIWPVLCTLGIHQSNETSGHLPSEHGSPHGRVHRRHTPDGRVCGAGDASSRSTALPIDRAGVHYQCAQVSDLPHSTDRVPGSPGALYHTTFEPARGKAPPHQVGSEPDPAERSGDSTSTGSSNRETTCSIPSSSPSSLVLSFPSRGSTEGTEQQQSRLHCIHQPVPSSQGRTTVVAGETCSMEWQSSGSPEGNSVDKVRCITAGMGSSVQWHQDRGTLEPGRAGNAYKLLAATLAVQSFLKDHTAVSVLLQLNNQTAVAYINNLGGDSFPVVDTTCEGVLDVGSIQEHNPCGGIHPRDYQLRGRC